MPVPQVSSAPTGGETARARTLLLDELLGDFPFAADPDRAHAVALFLLPFVRELISGPTPLHLIDKSTPGTGASLLAGILAYPALGRHPAMMPPETNEEEVRKRLTAQLLSAPSVVVIDNIRDLLDSTALSTAITAVEWVDRILGLF